jgi:hypothetical protein
MAVKSSPNFVEGSKWKPFKAATISYFDSLYSCKHRIPLAYVIWEQDAPNQDAAYESNHERLIAIMPLNGMEFEEDNGRVYDYLNSWILTGPSYAWMREYSRTRNGQAAWQGLIQHHEGIAQKDRVKSAAYSAFANARYQKLKKNYTFEKYVMTHKDAYQDLTEYGEIISEDKHVTDLLNGITDPTAAAAIQTIHATQHLCGFVETLKMLRLTLQPP